MGIYNVSIAALTACFVALAVLYLVLSLKQGMFEHMPLLVVLTGGLAILMGLYLIFAIRAGAFEGLLWPAGICLAFVAFAFVCLAIEARAV